MYNNVPQRLESRTRGLNLPVSLFTMEVEFVMTKAKEKQCSFSETFSGQNSFVRLFESNIFPTTCQFSFSKRGEGILDLT